MEWLSHDQLLKVLAGALLLIIGLSSLLIRTWRLLRQTEQQRLLLADQAAELQAMNATKDKLFSIVSHDLRTPVNNIHYLLQELQHTEGQTQIRLPLLNQLTDRVGLLSRLINNLLYWSLLQQGLLRDRPEPVDLRAVTTDCLALFTDAIQRKELVIQVSGSMPTVLADENQLLIIIRNLVDNAVKFSPVGGTVQLHWTSQPAGLSLDVSNETAIYAERSTGANLGLRVVAELLERQRGWVKTNSTGESGWQATVCWPANLMLDEVVAG